MPKDEFDFEDPLELNGVALLSEEDTSRDMAECFVEEFLRLGFNARQILAMFRNPHYTGMNMVLQNRGEPFVKEVIGEVFARWGRPVAWPQPGEPAGQCPSTPTPSAPGPVEVDAGAAADETMTDPLGNPAPRLNL